MLDNIILYFKNLPHTKRYVTERLKQKLEKFSNRISCMFNTYYCK